VTSQLAFSVQPSTVTAGAVIAPAVVVQAQDAAGNPTSSYTGDVTISIVTNAGGGALTGTVTAAAVGGVATFADLSINKSGTGYTLGAAAGGLTADQRRVRRRAGSRRRWRSPSSRRVPRGRRSARRADRAERLGNLD
jgi:hypothetical protein